MAIDPEAQAQLARLLADESLRIAPVEVLARAIEAHFGRLVDGVVAEAAASDDVFDRDSGLDFARRRVDNLSSVLSAEQQSRLLDAVQGKIEAW
jgi:hypothetical protein